MTNLATVPAAIVAPAGDIWEIADRVSSREKKSRTSQLEHAKKQAADVRAARLAARRGEWAPWCERAGLSQQRAWHYAEFGKSLVTSDFSRLTEDEQWAEWQRISGNPSRRDEEEDGPPEAQAAVQPAAPSNCEPSAPSPQISQRESCTTGTQFAPAPRGNDGASARPSAPPSPPAVPVPHVAHNSGENEWYTPGIYIDAARRVLGQIDLDPASSAYAQRTVQAGAFYTKEENGLGLDWSGKVWMNPPYAAGLVDDFISKLCEHFEAGDVPEAIVLVNNATETRWFRRCMDSSSAVCFPTGRIRYDSPTRESFTPLQGQAFLYLGPNSDRFVEIFRAFGKCALWCQEGGVS